MTTAVDTRDYFTDLSLLKDPYSYLATIRAQGPVYHYPKRDLYYVTGFEEAIEVLRNSEDFASVATAAGIAPLPFEPEGDDISEQIEKYRPEILGSDMVAAYDGPRHAALRSLISRIFTPSRLKENEEYIDRLADEIAAEMVAKGSCEVINEVATPYVTLVIADLLGVPDEDMNAFRDAIDAGPPPFDMTAVDSDAQAEPSSFFITCGTFFYNYVTDRRTNPRDDIMTELANASFPDGSVPNDIELVKTMMFLFGAGQDTTAKLLGNAIRYLAEDTELQQLLREDRTKVNGFIEEMLRMEGSVKATFRLAKRNASIGGVEIPAGKRVIIFLSGANRDPERWESPDEFQLQRERHTRHVAFGQGLHTCIGAPLARTEVRVILNKILDKTANFTLSETHHGGGDDRRIDYETSYVIRGLSNLHINITPA
ncbi:cytochrome P450 [Litorivivens sp.]|uniref:cytochrome P450 n=1 Tax=Litorivivens sp. TaxID=2020868 RepID=UPI003561377E